MAMRMTHAGTVAISSKAVTPQRFRPATKTRHLIEYDDPSHDVSVASSFYFSPTNNHHNQQKVTFLTPTKKESPTSFPPNEEATNMLQFLNEQGYQLQNDQFRSTKLPAYHHHHQAQQQQQQQAGSNNNNNNNNKTPTSFVSSSFSPKRRPKQMFKGKFAGVSSAALEEMKDDDDDDDDYNVTNFIPSSNSRRTKGYPSGSFFTIHEKGENKKRWKTLWFLFP